MEAGPAVVRFILDRSSESAARDEPTQDFLVIEAAPSRLCFAVTDGVGSSFLGQLAAQFLAGHLVDWLSALPEVPGESRLTAELTDALHRLAAEAGERIRTWPIPEQVTGVVREVLEQQRAYGSEAMFACGRIDLTQHGTARVGLAWLGDAQLRVLTKGGGQQNLSGRTADRWSSSRGPRGTVRGWVRPAAEVERVIGCSDGLQSVLDAVVELADDELENVVAELANGPDSDDIALVDVALALTVMPPPRETHHRDSENSPPCTAEDESAAPTTVTPPAGTSPVMVGSDDPRHLPGPCQPEQPKDIAEQIGSPTNVRWRPADRGYQLMWEAVKDADAYTVQLAEHQGFEEPVTYRVDGTRFVAPALGPQTWARLRAHRGDRSGPWGEGLQLTGEAPGTIPGQQPATDKPPESAPDRRGPQPGPAASITLRGRLSSFGQLSLRWAASAPVDGPYVVSVDDLYDSRPAREYIVHHTYFDLQLSPGRYQVRVRAVGRQQESLLSRLMDVRIPYG